MKAIVCENYGPPESLQFIDVEKPVPADNEVLLRLHAAAINPMDLFMMRGAPLLRQIPGMRKPKNKIIGCDIAGRVESIGKNVTQFQAGDEVFGGKGVGGFAEFICIPEDKLALKPANLSFEEAGSVTVAAITALQGLRDYGRIQAGQKVLIDGASGGVGTFAIQIAKAFGAEVTAVCSTRNLDLARSLGADHVIDYKREDFTRNRKLYNLILAANAHHSIFDYRRALMHDGILVLAGGGFGQIAQVILLGRIFHPLAP